MAQLDTYILLIQGYNVLHLQEYVPICLPIHFMRVYILTIGFKACFSADDETSRIRATHPVSSNTCAERLNTLAKAQLIIGEPIHHESPTAYRPKVKIRQPQLPTSGSEGNYN